MYKQASAGILTLTLLLGKSGLRAQDAPAAPEPVISTPRIERPDYWHRLYAPGALAKVSFGVLYDQAMNHDKEWGSGVSGFSKRAQLRFGTYTVRTTVEYSVSAMRHTDLRYTRCTCTGISRRTRHAFLQALSEGREDGSRTLPLSRLAGIYSSSLVTLPLEPRRYGVADAMNHSAALVGASLGTALWHEFSPEIKRKILRGHFQRFK